MQIDELDSPPTPEGGDISSPNGTRGCIQCGNPLPAGADGRFKYCDDCKANKTQGTKQTRQPRAKSLDQLIESIAGLYAGVGMGLSFIPGDGFVQDGMVVGAESRKLAESWRPLCEKDPAIRKAWEKITTGTGWGAVIITHGMVALAIAGNHGVSLPWLPKPQQSQEPQSQQGGYAE